MAKVPPSKMPDLVLVDSVEQWLDQRIQDDCIEFTMKVEIIESQFNKLSDADWAELEGRYRKAGWGRVEHNHWTSMENNNGPYFRLSA